MPIVNENPLSIQAGEYWATALYITEKRVNGTLVPYDGTVIVADPALMVKINQALPSGIAGPLFAAAAALSGGPVDHISVTAPTPSGKVVAKIGGTFIGDLFAVLGGNQQANSVYGALIDWLSDAIKAQAEIDAEREAARAATRANIEAINARRIAAGKTPILKGGA